MLQNRKTGGSYLGMALISAIPKCASSRVAISRVVGRLAFDLPQTATPGNALARGSRDFPTRSHAPGPGEHGMVAVVGLKLACGWDDGWVGVGGMSSAPSPPLKF